MKFPFNDSFRIQIIAAINMFLGNPLRSRHTTLNRWANSENNFHDLKLSYCFLNITKRKPMNFCEPQV